MLKVTTLNSVYWVDDLIHMYLREAGTRKQDVISPRLEYEAWHELRDWCIEADFEGQYKKFVSWRTRMPCPCATMNG